MSNDLKEIKKIGAVLSDHLEPNTEILKHETRILCAPGENYGSVMLAVDVTVQEPDQPPKTLHLVGKRIPANDLLCEIFNIQFTYKKEIAIYTEAIPTLIKFEEEYKKTSKFAELFAKSYGARINLNNSDKVDEDAVLFLENLKIAGFDTGDRLVGFDEEHVYKILEDLARFHAVPIAFKTKKPDEFKKYILPHLKAIKIADGLSEEVKLSSTQDIIDVLKENKEFDQYIDKIFKTVYKNMAGYVRFLTPNEPFATIAHTDFWVNNTMIKKDKLNKPIKNIIVDLQLACYGSGIMDLLFFIYSSIRPDVLHENEDKFIKFYYDCFIECLQEFDIDVTPFAWEKFLEEIRKVAYYELGHILVMYRPILTKRGVVEDMKDMDTDILMEKGHLNHDYEERTINCVRSFINHKWI